MRVFRFSRFRPVIVLVGMHTGFSASQTPYSQRDPSRRQREGGDDTGVSGTKSTEFLGDDPPTSGRDCATRNVTLRTDPGFSPGAGHLRKDGQFGAPARLVVVRNSGSEAPRGPGPMSPRGLPVTARPHTLICAARGSKLTPKAGSRGPSRRWPRAAQGRTWGAACSRDNPGFQERPTHVST